MATSAEMKKDPDAELDYGVDWGPWLQEGESISTSQWIADEGITIMSDPASSVDGGITIVWLSGGTERLLPYTVTNRITTSEGRGDDRSLTIRVVER